MKAMVLLPYFSLPFCHDSSFFLLTHFIFINFANESNKKNIKESKLWFFSDFELNFIF